ncbi:Uncharacterised protein [Klebsiella pneumoniae]|uniref:Uncharacterized protein n=1 Tax=Klebsiella pneumoniae TaxID=573 RepID=A0A447RSJ1_KLEPN|nr:Uncharacterised protein [Klebsiella pneumoniae]VEB02796.1 Uncharacterised protein [Klebsiella pneumoniae]
MGALVKVFILHQLYIADVGKMNSLTPRKFGQDGVHVIIRIFGNRAGAERNAVGG